MLFGCLLVLKRTAAALLHLHYNWRPVCQMLPSACRCRQLCICPHWLLSSNASNLQRSSIHRVPTMQVSQATCTGYHVYTALIGSGRRKVQQPMSSPNCFISSSCAVRPAQFRACADAISPRRFAWYCPWVVLLPGWRKSCNMHKVERFWHYNGN